jgi:hypothetical protein
MVLRFHVDYSILKLCNLEICNLAFWLSLLKPFETRYPIFDYEYWILRLKFVERWRANRSGNIPAHPQSKPTRNERLQILYPACENITTSSCNTVTQCQWCWYVCIIYDIFRIHTIEYLGPAQNCWVLGLCLSSGILEARKHNVSETWSVSVLRWGGRRLLSTNLDQWSVF